MTKAIFFDIGGVLIDLDFEACLRAFREILGFERIDEILNPYKQRGIFGDMEGGRITADEFRTAILAESREGAVPEDVDRCLEHFLTGMDPKKVPLLKELSARLPLFTLSNNNPIAMGLSRKVFAENGLAWENIFTDNFISCDMKMEKPGPELYAEAIRRSGFAPEDILYIDDGTANVEAGLKAGLKTVLYVAGEDLRALIEANL